MVPRSSLRTIVSCLLLFFASAANASGDPAVVWWVGAAFLVHLVVLVVMLFSVPLKGTRLGGRCLLGMHRHRLGARWEFEKQHLSDRTAPDSRSVRRRLCTPRNCHRMEQENSRKTTLISHSCFAWGGAWTDGLPKTRERFRVDCAPCARFSLKLSRLRLCFPRRIGLTLNWSDS